QPGEERTELLRLIAAERLHHEVIVAHENIKTLVDAGRVGELFMGMAGGERSDGRVERRGVTEASVLVASGKGAGDAAQRTAARDGGAAERGAGAALFLGSHFSGDVYL